MTSSRNAPKPLQLAAIVIGNALEWYDFISFGFLIVIISRLFFPAESEYASMLATTATFGVGFFMRPVGGVLLGLYADRYGRKAALLLIIVLMTVAIAMIGFAPTYAAIGIAAPLIMVLARLLQGFATGGEFASATSFLIESAPANRRGFYGSWQMVGQGLALLTGAVIGALLTRNLSPEAMDSWGWRVPFLFGLLIGPVGIYIRRHLNETEAFLDSRAVAADRRDFAVMLRAHLKDVLVCAGIVTSATIQFYVILLYMPTFARVQLQLPLDEGFIAQSIGLACMIVLTPVFGALSDRIGRRPILVGSLLLTLVLIYPLFEWVSSAPSFGRLAAMQVVLCSLLGGLHGPISTAVAEQFPAGWRSTGLGIGYNTAVMTFGGSAQFLVTWLIEATGSALAPALYVMFGATVGITAAIFLVDRAREAELPVLSRARPIAETA